MPQFDWEDNHGSEGIRWIAERTRQNEKPKPGRRSKMRQRIGPRARVRSQDVFLVNLGTAPNYASIYGNRGSESPFGTLSEEVSIRHVETQALSAPARVAMFCVTLVASAFCCAMALLVPLAFCLAIWGPSEVSVNLPADGATLELAVVRGDEIRLRLFDTYSSPDLGLSSAYLQLTHAQTDSQTTQLAHIEEGARNRAGIRPIYARIPIPSVPGIPATDLSGHFGGEVVLESGDRRSLEVPVALHLVPRSDTEPSGQRDTTGADRAVLIFGVVALLATAAMTAQLYSDWLKGKWENWLFYFWWP